MDSQQEEVSKVQLTEEDNSLDDSDTLSFIILGKKSLDSIQALSVADYADIKQKCMSLDYNSIISSLNSSEIQQKLKELLQENVKLKEILKQNTTAMKQQFNTLAMWQEKLMNVHKHHKQKFAETRQLINILKEENAELKLKLYALNVDDALTVNTENADNLSKFSPLQEKVPSLSSVVQSGAEENLMSSFHTISPFNFKLNSEKLSEDVKEDINPSNAMSVRLEESTPTIEKQSCEINKSETDDIKDIKDIKDNCQIEDASKLSSFLEDDVKSPHTPRNLNIAQTWCHIISLQSYYFTQSIKVYGEKLKELTDCFVRQVTRYTDIQKYIKECINVLDACESIKLPDKRDTIEENWLLQLEQLQVFKEKLSTYQKILLEEQLELISDRQCFIKFQNQFQKIFSDYNSLLHELQIMSEENGKLRIMKDNIVKETTQKISELEKHKNENEQKCREMESVLEKERQSWNEQKTSLDNQRKSLNMEYKYLIHQKEMLFSLHEEKTLVEKRCQLCEYNETILQANKETFKKNYAQLAADRDALYVKLEEKDNALKELGTINDQQDEQIKQQAEEIELLKTQILFYEEDFQSEKKAKESLLIIKDQLQEALNNAFVASYSQDLVRP